MIRILHIPIQSSKRTCVCDGKPCMFLSQHGLTRQPVCSLFKAKLVADDQRDNGEPHRCSECTTREE